jgi:hydrogenase maturation protease
VNAIVDRIANAVLYEGYILYPYRPSVKNRQRWTFGGLYPESYCQHQRGGDASSNQTECLVQGNSRTVLDLTIRFLHLTDRRVGQAQCDVRSAECGVVDFCTPHSSPAFQYVEALEVAGKTYHAWQEAEECRVEMRDVFVQDILSQTRRQGFTFTGRRWLEPLCGPDGHVEGVLERRQEAINGEIEVKATEVDEGFFKVTLRTVNLTTLDDSAHTSRDDALLRTLVSAHAILAISQGQFVSLLDPPEQWRNAAAGCKNVGTWPVLVGEEGTTDTILSSPIILYDYPQIAPESAGDLFDATEIDEILTLRILTLTDEEKRAAASLDGRADDLLRRTESLARDQLSKLHGTMRRFQPLQEAKQ